MKALKRKIVRTALLVLVCLAVVAPVTAAELESLLPAETLLYAKWSGRSLTFDGSKFGQMILDPEVKNLFGFVQGLIQENVGHDTEVAVFAWLWDCAAIAWQHPIALGVYDINKKGASAVLLIDLGDDKAAFEQEFKKIFTLASSRTHSPGDQPQGLTLTTVGEGSYSVFPCPNKNIEPAFGYIGNVFFFTVGPDQAKALLERKPDASLCANQKYLDCMKAVSGEDVQIALYADVTAIGAQVEALFAPPTPNSAPAEAASQPAVSPMKNITKALGVDKIQALAGTVRVVDKGMYTKVKLFTPPPHQGLLLPLAGATLSDADLSGVPGDADMAVAINLSPKAAYDEFRRVLKEINPGMDVFADEVVMSLEKKLKFSLENDLLASLGDTWVYSVSPSQGGPIVGSMITVDVTDPEKLQTLINNLESQFLPPPPDTSATTQPANQPMPRRSPYQPRIEIMKVGDTEIHYLRTTMGQIGVAFLPAWAVHKNRLYVALWPQVIASALENTTEPLTNRPEYQELRKRFNPNASAMVYINTPEIMKKLYPLQLVVGTVVTNAIAARTGTNLPVPLWPGSLNSVLKYLLPQMNVISHDAEGITMEGYGTCPSILPAAPVVLGAGAAVAMPALNNAREKEKKSVSASHLKGLGMGLVLYNEDEGGFPENPAVLVERGYASPKNFISPVSGKGEPRVENGEFLDPVDYFYVRPGNGDATPDDTVMMYEDPANYQNRGTFVLYKAGYVGWVEMNLLGEMVAKAKELSEKTPTAAPAAAEKDSDF